jgi:hypothetical protein
LINIHFTCHQAVEITINVVLILAPKKISGILSFMIGKGDCEEAKDLGLRINAIPPRLT